MVLYIEFILIYEFILIFLHGLFLISNSVDHILDKEIELKYFSNIPTTAIYN